MRVQIISDLVEVEGYTPKYVLDSLFQYLTTDQALEFAYDFERIYDLDIQSMTMQEAIDQDIITPEMVINEADQYFSDYVQRDFIDHFSKMNS